MMQPRSQHTGSVHSSQPLSSCSRLQRRVPASRPLQGAGRWPVRSCRQGMAGASLAIVLGAAARPSGAPLKGAWPVCLQGSLVRGCRCVITPVESVSWLEGPLLYSVTRDGPCSEGSNDEFSQQWRQQAGLMCMVKHATSSEYSQRHHMVLQPALPVKGHTFLIISACEIVSRQST